MTAHVVPSYEPLPNSRRTAVTASFSETFELTCDNIEIIRHGETKGDFGMHDIPETGFLRLPQVLSVIPLGKTSWWEGVKSGRFPKPIKLSARCTAWRAEDIRQLIEKLSDCGETN